MTQYEIKERCMIGDPGIGTYFWHCKKGRKMKIWMKYEWKATKICPIFPGSAFLDFVQFFCYTCLSQLLCPGIKYFHWKKLDGCVDPFVSLIWFFLSKISFNWIFFLLKWNFNILSTNAPQFDHTVYDLNWFFNFYRTKGHRISISWCYI